MLKNPEEQKIRALLEHGGKLKAIQFVIQETGISLHEAKDYVDSLCEPERQPLPAEHPAKNVLDANQIFFLIGRGKKIEAIRYVREQTGLDLRQAKDYVEKLSASICGARSVNDAQNGPPQRKPVLPAENWSLRKRILILCASFLLPALFMLLMLSLDRYLS